jgi:hypothetical protein
MNTATDEFGIPEDLIPPPSKKAKAIDPEDDRANWPVIHIDFEDGKPNYEYIGVAGTKRDGSPFTHNLQVQRGVDAAVPPSIVNMLRSTKEKRYRQVPDPQTGRMQMICTERSPMPWQLVEKGKYIK